MRWKMPVVGALMAGAVATVAFGVAVVLLKAVAGMANFAVPEWITSTASTVSALNMTTLLFLWVTFAIAELVRANLALNVPMVREYSEAV